MTAKDKRVFIRELCRAVEREVLDKVGKMPDSWDGHELRRYLADAFEESSITLKRGTRDRSYRARLREYEATVLERGL